MRTTGSWAAYCGCCSRPSSPISRASLAADSECSIVGCGNRVGTGIDRAWCTAAGTGRGVGRRSFRALVVADGSRAPPGGQRATRCGGSSCRLAMRSSTQRHGLVARVMRVAPYTGPSSSRWGAYTAEHRDVVAACVWDHGGGQGPCCPSTGGCPRGLISTRREHEGPAGCSASPLVGYGLQSLDGPAFRADDRQGSDPERQLEQTFVTIGLRRRTPRGNGTGGSGTCLGDSGGPILLRRLQRRHRRRTRGRSKRELHRERLSRSRNRPPAVRADEPFLGPSRAACRNALGLLGAGRSPSARASILRGRPRARA